MPPRSKRRAVAAPSLAAAEPQPDPPPVPEPSAGPSAPPKRSFVITGGIVPPGTLPPNKNHPLALLTPEERERHAEIALGNLVLALARKGK